MKRDDVTPTVPNVDPRDYAHLKRHRDPNEQLRKHPDGSMSIVPGPAPTPTVRILN